MNKYKRLGKNTLLVFIGNAGAKLIGLIMLPFYTRWLSVDDYGTTDIINVYASLLVGLATACIADSIFIFPKGQSEDNKKSYFSSGLIFSFFSLLITSLLFFLIEIISNNKGFSNSFVDNIWFIYGILSTSFFQQYIQQFTRSIDKMSIYSTTGIVYTATTALFSFLLIPRYGVSGYVGAIIGANIFAAFYSLFFSKSYTFFSIKYINKTKCVEMLKYSIPLIPNVIMWWLVSALNRPLMETHLGMHAIGIFAVANKIPGILSMVFTIFTLSWQISVLEEFGKKGYAVFYNKILRMLITGLLFIYFLLTICGDLIIKIFTTPAFYEAKKYTSVLLLGVIFLSIAGFVGSNFSATKESKYFFFSSVWAAIASVVLNLLLIPKYGIMGAAIAVLLSFCVMAFTRILYAWKYVKIYNIGKYFLNLLLALSLIFIMDIQLLLLKWVLIIIILILFIIINADLKDDFSKLYYDLKSKVVKK